MPFVHLRRDNKNLQFYWMLFFSSPDTGAPNGLYCTQQALFIKDHGMKMNCIWKPFSSKKLLVVNRLRVNLPEPGSGFPGAPARPSTHLHTRAEIRGVFMFRQRCCIWEPTCSGSCSSQCMSVSVFCDFFYYYYFFIFNLYLISNGSKILPLAYLCCFKVVISNVSRSFRAHTHTN